MRRAVLSLLLAICLLLCSCGKAPAPAGVKTPDMLNITNTDADFAGCLQRFEAVCSALEAKVTVLETAHNKKIETNSSGSYFLEDNYILTGFAPFQLKLRAQVAGFSDDLTDADAQALYRAAANGKKIEYTAGKQDYTLRFVSEAQSELYTAAYDKANDSLRCTYVSDDGVNETMEEFLEFLPLGDNAYAIQSQLTRCEIRFDAEGNISSFTCAQAQTPINTDDDSIFPGVKPWPADWVLAKGHDAMALIHTYDDDVLLHEDRSGGPWKEIKINAANYASAFYEA